MRVYQGRNDGWSFVQLRRKRLLLGRHVQQTRAGVSLRDVVLPICQDARVANYDIATTSTIANESNVIHILNVYD